MSPSVPQDLIDAATAYETLFVPALFQQWAPMLADAVGIKSGDRVLDVACGTGVLGREAAARIGPSGRVTGLDPHAGMLAVARDLSPAIGAVDQNTREPMRRNCGFDSVADARSLVTSQRCAIAVPLALLMRAAVSLAAASSMSRPATLAPASAKVDAMARPMPNAHDDGWLTVETERVVGHRASSRYLRLPFSLTGQRIMGPISNCHVLQCEQRVSRRAWPNL